MVVLGWWSIAAGKPLPDGTKVVLVKDQLFFVDHDVTVPLYAAGDRELMWTFDSVRSVKLSDDDKTIEIEGSICSYMMAKDAASASFDAVRARVENVRGMQLHLKKKYADAVAHFAAAVKLDPKTPVYATNLLSAQSMGKLLADADQTLATAGPRAVAWFAWRLAVDSDLANLRGRASTRPFTSIARTKLAADALEGSVVAVSPAGFLALEQATSFGMTPASSQDLVIYDQHGAEQVRVPLIEFDDLCLDSCTKAQQAHTAEHRRAASELLGVLGFSTQHVRWVDVAGPGRVASPDKQVVVDVADDKITITHGKATSTVPVDGTVNRLGFAAGAIVIVARTSHGCGGTDNTWNDQSVVAVP